MEIAFDFSFLVLLLSLSIVFWRLLKGPHSVDRIICLDLLALISGGMFATHAVRVDLEFFVDAVLLISIIAFLSTIVLGRMIESMQREKGNTHV